MMPILSRTLLVTLSLLAPGCVTGIPSRPTPTVPTDLPTVPREFRAAWIATVANIDWPSRPGLPASLQREELRGILDRCADANLNAVVLQVRPHGDALYASPLEPWSAYLSGTQGAPPRPEYDPLEFAVEEAHLRGIELHAWFNPYRAGHPSDKSPRAANHFQTRHPQLVHRYGTYDWMDPASPEVQEHALRVMLDVVRRYDIDGVHMDDYFYPYPIQDREGRSVPFPDDALWDAYRAGGGPLERADWRRAAVDGFVERLYTRIKAIKPHVRVGISPFGIWRPGHPGSVRGLDAYEALYADARKWLQRGWVDYLAPQLYWPMRAPQQGFAALLQWWQDQNVAQRSLWPGLAAHRVDPSRENAFDREELSRQIETMRLICRKDPGALFFSAKVLVEDRWEQATTLRQGVFATQALVPPVADGPGLLPGAVTATASVDNQGLWVHAAQESLLQARSWVVQVRGSEGWQHQILPAARSSVRLPWRGAPPADVIVFAVDRAGRAGPPVAVEVVPLP